MFKYFDCVDDFTFSVQKTTLLLLIAQPYIYCNLRSRKNTFRGTHHPNDSGCGDRRFICPLYCGIEAATLFQNLHSDISIYDQPRSIKRCLRASPQQCRIRANRPDIRFATLGHIEQHLRPTRGKCSPSRRDDIRNRGMHVRVGGPHDRHKGTCE